MRASLDVTLPRRTGMYDGRVKKPSMRMESVPSLRAMVVTPMNVARSVGLGFISG